MSRLQDETRGIAYLVGRPSLHEGGLVSDGCTLLLIPNARGVGYTGW